MPMPEEAVRCSYTVDMYVESTNDDKLCTGNTPYSEVSLLRTVSTNVGTLTICLSLYAPMVLSYQM